MVGERDELVPSGCRDRFVSPVRSELADAVGDLVGCEGLVERFDHQGFSDEDPEAVGIAFRRAPQGLVDLPASVRWAVFLAADAGVDLSEAVPVVGPDLVEPGLDVLGGDVMKGLGERVRVDKADIADAVSKG